VSKLTLEFTLPEETEEMRTAVNAGNMRSAVYDFDMKLRNILRHGTMPELDVDTVERVRSMLHECLDDNEVSI